MIMDQVKQIAGSLTGIAWISQTRYVVVMMDSGKLAAGPMTASVPERHIRAIIWPDGSIDFYPNGPSR